MSRKKTDNPNFESFYYWNNLLGIELNKAAQGCKHLYQICLSVFNSYYFILNCSNFLPIILKQFEFWVLGHLVSLSDLLVLVKKGNYTSNNIEKDNFVYLLQFSESFYQKKFESLLLDRAGISGYNFF